MLGGCVAGVAETVVLGVAAAGAVVGEVGAIGNCRTIGSDGALGVGEAGAVCAKAGVLPSASIAAIAMGALRRWCVVLGMVT